MLGLVLRFSTLSGCGNNTATDTEVSTEAEESDTLYGEVSSVSDDSITIEVGTYSSDDGTLTPVSYTHLDVYKRQVLS